jgi:ABC-type lipoprotein export system ATPase subunit
MTKPLLIARDLCQSFRIGKRRIEVLRGISLDVTASEVSFLVGASGAGKTTLLYTLAGLERPETGEVLFDGRSIYAMNGRDQARIRNTRMGFIFQGYHLLPELTALENVRLPAMMGDAPRRIWTSGRVRC